MKSTPQSNTQPTKSEYLSKEELLTTADEVIYELLINPYVRERLDVFFWKDFAEFFTDFFSTYSRDRESVRRVTRYLKWRSFQRFFIEWIQSEDALNAELDEDQKKFSLDILNTIGEELDTFMTAELTRCKIFDDILLDSFPKWYNLHATCDEFSIYYKDDGELFYLVTDDEIYFSVELFARSIDINEGRNDTISHIVFSDGKKTYVFNQEQAEVRLLDGNYEKEINLASGTYICVYWTTETTVFNIHDGYEFSDVCRFISLNEIGDDLLMIWEKFHMSPGKYGKLQKTNYVSLRFRSEDDFEELIEWNLRDIHQTKVWITLVVEEDEIFMSEDTWVERRYFTSYYFIPSDHNNHISSDLAHKTRVFTRAEKVWFDYEVEKCKKKNKYVQSGLDSRLITSNDEHVWIHSYHALPIPMEFDENGEGIIEEEEGGINNKDIQSVDTRMCKIVFHSTSSVFHNIARIERINRIGDSIEIFYYDADGKQWYLNTSYTYSSGIGINPSVTNSKLN